MDKLTLFNLSATVSGIILCAVGILQILFGPKFDKRTMRYFLLSYGSTFLSAVLDFISQMVTGMSGPVVRTFLYLAYFGQFLFPCLLAYTISLYLLSLADSENELKPVRYGIHGCFLIFVFLLVLSQWNGMFYTLDRQNVYHRNDMYPVAMLLIMAMVIMDWGVLVTRRDRLTKYERTAFWTYFLLAVLGVLIQVVIYGIATTVIVTTLAVLVMYVFITSDQSRRYNQQVQENTDLKVHLMLSQIRPHFLHNSLWVIQEICKTDPEKASQALEHFSTYLRHNMNALTSEKMILFSEELEHTRSYISLQKLRFGDDLEVIYDLETEAFLIPTLTLQPMVENAVTHGIRMKESGSGTIVISTHAYADGYEVSVTDDGPGFDPDHIAREGRGLGIQNVRIRLKQMCNGNLEIHSRPGSGTTVILTIPRNR